MTTRTAMADSLTDRERDSLELAYAAAPRVPWDIFVSWFAQNWTQSQHVTLLGPTGRGKTVVLKKLLELRTYTALMVTKPRDDELSGLETEWWRTWLGERDGYVQYKEWPVTASPRKFPRRIIWPDARSIHADTVQKAVFASAFEHIFAAGGWCVALDEAWYVASILGLQKELRMLLTQGRSIGLSIVGATQRPRHVPLEFYSMADHLFFFRATDSADIGRLSELSSVNASQIRLLVQQLEQYQMLYVNALTGMMMRTRYSEAIERGMA